MAQRSFENISDIIKCINIIILVVFIVLVILISEISICSFASVVAATVFLLDVYQQTFFLERQCIQRTHCLTNKLWHYESNFFCRIHIVISGTKFILHNNVNFSQFNHSLLLNWIVWHRLSNVLLCLCSYGIYICALSFIL